jgi:hypothetical protein
VRKFTSILAVSIILSACSTTRDGINIGVGGAPSTSDVVRIRDQLEQNAQTSTGQVLIKSALLADMQPGVILVGTVGPLRKVNEEARRKYYPSYVKQAEQWHPNHPPYVTESDFVAQAGGWTSVETFAIPGIMNIRFPAVVRVSDMDNIGFASTFGSFVAGTTGDLIAAKSNQDGMYFVDKVLCKDAASDYSDCAHQYQRGRFDLNSGIELDRNLKPKSDGAQIDILTFKVKSAQK